MNNKKESNPKQAMGGTKVPFSTLSQAVTAEVGLGMLEGARKYGRHNWRVAGARASTYMDATNRHLSAWWEGEDIDPYSGLSHITKAICSLYVLRDAMINENWVDDRPPALPEGWMDKMNEMVQDINERYPDAVEPFTKEPLVKELRKSPGVSIQEPPTWFWDDNLKIPLTTCESKPLETTIVWDDYSSVYSKELDKNVYMDGTLSYNGNSYEVIRKSPDSYSFKLRNSSWKNNADIKIDVEYNVSNINYTNAHDKTYYAYKQTSNRGDAKVCKSLKEAIDQAEEWNSQCYSN